MPYPGLLHPEPLPLQQVTADLYFQRTLKHSSGSVSVEFLGPSGHKVCLSPPSITDRYGLWGFLPISFSNVFLAPGRVAGTYQVLNNVF